MLGVDGRRGGGRRRVGGFRDDDRGHPHHRCRSAYARVAQGCGPIDERLGASVEPREPQREPGLSRVRLLPEADDAPFAPEHRLAALQDDLEAQYDPLRARLRAKEDHARPSERVELPLEVFLLGRVRARDADRDGRLLLVCHAGSIRYRSSPEHGNRAPMTETTDLAIRARVLVVGGGAREHAIASELAREGCSVIVAPGNAGTRAVARNEAARADDVASIVSLAERESVDLVVVGPELPLTLGAVDALSAKGILAFGPSRAAARLEGSKAHMKRFCTRHGIPTAAYEIFDDASAAERYVRAANRPLVVKADGLAAGKGVVVAGDADEALMAIDRIMRKRELGEAGATVVIEEILPGEEASFHVVCDGTRFVALAPAQDHKRVFDGDRGPNTGGMGAYAPAPVVTRAVDEQVRRAIVEPTLAGMEKDGTPFRGVLFVGLMIDAGVPRVLEYNVRFGDPETAVIVPLLAAQTSLFRLLDGAARGDLRASIDDLAAHSTPEGSALCVVMAAEGYPATPSTGDEIFGLEARVAEGAYVLHAGTALRDGAVVTAGGRVLAVGARARTLEDAATIAYRTVDAIHWRGEHHRRDIGHRARARVC